MISSLAYRNLENQKLLGQAGVCEALAQVLVAHQRSADEALLSEVIDDHNVPMKNKT
jgi:hypothetical protein